MLVSMFLARESFLYEILCRTPIRMGADGTTDDLVAVVRWGQGEETPRASRVTLCHLPRPPGFNVRRPKTTKLFNPTFIA